MGDAAALAQQLPDRTVTSEEPHPWHLFAFPLESNFSGVRYDEALGDAATALLERPIAGDQEADVQEEVSPAGPRRRRRGRWAVLLDAAKGCGSRPPDLSKNPVDFVVRGSRCLLCLGHMPGYTNDKCSTLLTCSRFLFANPSP